jgi:predicted ATPase/DNA-binding SARP family transcriptional activator
MDARCRIQLLGGLRVQQGDRVITRFRTQKTGALLAHLAYHLHQAPPREVLVDLLWSDSELQSGQNSLRVAVSSLRHQLEPPGVPAGSVIKTDRFSVQLNPDAITTDVREFQAALESAETAGSGIESRQYLGEAVGLYGGPLLPGYYLDWIPTEQERLADHYFDALHSLMAHLEEAGETEAALDHARRAVGVEPLREDGHRHVIRLLAASGQSAAALQQYRELERILTQELEASPSAATRQLVEQLPEVEESTVARELPLTASSAAAVGPPLPVGTVTFLLTDVEGARDLEREAGECFEEALAQYPALLREQFRRYRGSKVKEVRGSFVIAFARPSDALQCAVACQQALTAHSWPEGTDDIRVRMTLDMGEAELTDGRYQSPVLDRATGLLLAAHGGQVLCSEAVAVLLRPDLEAETRLADLGFYRLRSGGGPERLFSVNYPGMVPEGFPPPNAALAYTSNLPSQFTRFFGREEELERLQELLLTDETRLVTLTGPPGSGKTRLALECAQQLLETLDGPVWFAPLQALRDPQLIVGAVLDALSLARRPDLEPLDQIAEALSHQPSLLVLDNFEQLIEEGAVVVRGLLERVPSLTCLVTSRRGLDLTGETQFPLAPLPTPAGKQMPDELMRCASVQLFVDRAQAVRPDFQVTKASAPIISELCERLEGIPLALELAASRAQVLTPSHMLTQLRDRFDFLVSRKRDVEDRHRTLHGALEWSYQLLPPELQRLFSRLSVFRGGWAVPAAEAVCDEPQALEHLTQLEECSLILTDDAADAGEEPRFRMLETLREDGAGLLSPQETAPLRQRHAEHFLGVAHDLRPVVSGHIGDQAAALRRVSIEHDNFRAALAWSKSTEDRGEMGLRLICDLSWFWRVRGHRSEVRRHLDELLARDDTAAHTEQRLEALRIAGGMAGGQYDYGAAKSLYEESLEIARELGHKGVIAIVYHNQGWLARLRGDYARALPLLEEALTMAREAGNQHLVIYALGNLGWMALEQGKHKGARALLEEALAIGRKSGHREALASICHSLGELASAEGDYAGARVHFGEALATGRELESRDAVAEALHGLGKLASSQGDLAGARSLLGESLQMGRELGRLHKTVPCLEALATVCVGERRYEQAARVWGAAEALRERIGVPLPPPDQPDRESGVAALRAHLGEDAFFAAWAEGREMSWDEVVAYALEGSAEQIADDTV